MATTQSQSELERLFYEGRVTGTLPVGAAPTGRTSAEAASTATPAANILALTDKVLVKTGSTRLLTYNIQNPNAAAIFVQLFSAANIAAVTLGTTVPLAWLAVPAGGVLDGYWATSEPFNLGLVVAATQGPQNSVLAAAGCPVSLQVV